MESNKSQIRHNIYIYIWYHIYIYKWHSRRKKSFIDKFISILHAKQEFHHRVFSLMSEGFKFSFTTKLIATITNQLKIDSHVCNSNHGGWGAILCVEDRYRLVHLHIWLNRGYTRRCIIKDNSSSNQATSCFGITYLQVIREFTEGGNTIGHYLPRCRRIVMVSMKVN